jgi:hypothetical protein
VGEQVSTLAELNGAIDQIGELVKKYASLLNAQINRGTRAGDSVRLESAVLAGV